MSDAKFDSKRRLCPDGSCIGVVGDDGRCKVCGRDAGGGAKSAAAAASGPVAVSAATTDASDLDSGRGGDSDGDGADDNDDNDVTAADAAEPGALSFDPARRLCSDGNCIGLIGPNGNCNVCGQPASE